MSLIAGNMVGDSYDYVGLQIDQKQIYMDKNKL